MKELKTLGEIEQYPEIYNTMESIIDNLVDNKEDKSQDISEYLGGSIFIIDDAEEIQNIEGYSIYSTADKTNMSVNPVLIDGYEFTDNYNLITIVKSDGGGPTYFINKSIKNENLNKSVEEYRSIYHAYN